MKNEKGFTLVEVLASLVIISIVLMSFMAIFGNTNRLAITNSEKLVVINLADSYLERFKIDPKGTINLKRLSNIPEYSFPPTLTACPVEGKTNNMCTTISLNNLDPVNSKKYVVTIHISQDASEKNLSIYNIVVTVKADASKLSSSVEGYVSK